MHTPVISPRQAALHPRSATAAAFLTTLLALPVQAAVTLPEIPLQTSATVSPNIMFILDDSGSMQSEILPDETIDPVTRNTRGGAVTAITIGRVFPRIDNLYGSTFNGGAVGNYANYVADPDNVFGRIVRTPEFNPQYYNPKTTYKPWAKANGTSYADADPKAVYWNPSDTSKGSMDLTTTQTFANVNWQRTDSTYCKTSACLREVASDSNTRQMEMNVYYTFDGDANDPKDKYDASQYTKVTVTGDELKNFANWFQFYRSRILASRGGIGRAFATLPDSATGSPRIGYATINTTDALVSAVRPFSGTDRSDFYDKLYTGTIPTMGTPLRGALQSIGNYYTTETGANDPWRTDVGDTSAAKHNEYLACRQSFAMLMTDGYWNGDDEFDVGNVDSAATYPFKDSHSNTLADVAYSFWKSDLRDAIADKVPPSKLDPATYQHMVTYGIGLGVSGSINSRTAFDEIGKTSGSISWPNPDASSDGYVQANKIDDLLHAGVNSRGGFFSAGDPDTFASELTKTLASIVERSASGSNVAANSVSIGTNTKIFQASFISGAWTGELAAFPVTSDVVATTPAWKASELIPAASGRKLFTHNGTGVNLAWASLSASQQSALGNDSKVLDYLRGDRSGERQNGGNFRNRAHVLGDIVNSSPAFSTESNTVFVGSNDGMLHAFAADTGLENFAYLPAGIDWSKLRNLTSTSYSHNFFVDGPVVVSEKSLTPAKNLLVGSYGRGGKGLYSLDVTSPSTFAATDVKWEYSGDDDMGMVLSRPILSTMNNGDTAAIVANGPNSNNDGAALFIIKLSDGSVIRKIDTGVDYRGNNALSAPRGWDDDGDGTVDYVYAGDLKGNLWKFDLSDKNETKWTIANTGKPMFTAKDADGKAQPISGGVTLATDPTSFNTWVFFGTGRFMTSDDPSDKSVQSWYGLIDSGKVLASRNEGTKFKLKERKIVVSRTIDLLDATGKKIGTRLVRAFEQSVAGDMSGKDGWFMDLNLPGATSTDPRIAEGERMVGQPSIIGETLLASSIIPSSDACSGGGRGFLNAIDAFSGGRTERNFFDANGDGKFNDTLADSSGGGETPKDAAIGSVDLNVAMPTDSALVDSRAVVGGSDGRRQDVKTNNPAQTGRISWREIIRD